MNKMNILLIHQEDILHYRVAIYNYLAKYLAEKNINFNVFAECIQKDSPYPIDFDFIEKSTSVVSIAKTFITNRPDAIILFVNLKHLYLFPVIMLAKIMGIKVIYWGHGKDVQDPDAIIKNLLYRLEFILADQIILYSDMLIKHVKKKHRHKIHIANNTLATNRKYFPAEELHNLKEKYGIQQKVSIVFVGRIQKYKRVEDLVSAFIKIKNDDIGLLIIGSDDENLVGSVEDKRIHCLGPVYGDELAMFLSLADIYCMPGAIGLSIVDAFQYGLPIITENVQHGPEIMYLKDGINGYVVPIGDIDSLAEKIELLSTNIGLRKEMSNQAIKEISTNGSINKMCEGFLSAIYACCDGQSHTRKL